MKKYFLTILACLVFLLVGGHWALLQGIAWGKMIHDNSQTVPISQAVIMTFSGDHPCPLCHAIAHGRKAQNDEVFSLTSAVARHLPSGELAYFVFGILLGCGLPSSWFRLVPSLTSRLKI